MIEPRRVLIVDDMASVRSLVRQSIEDDPGIEVVGEAGDAQSARAMIKRLKPDVMTLDIEMPGIRGDMFLRQVMAVRPMPVIMLSQLTRANSPAAIAALADGAVDCIQKPTGLAQLLDGSFKARLRGAIRDANLSAPNPLLRRPAAPRRDFDWNGRVVFIGASTGGVAALESVLTGFPARCPPVLIAQHIPSNFLPSLAAWLRGRIVPEVEIAQDGMEILPGRVLLAPGGDRDMIVDRRDRSRVALIPHDAELPFCPSVDGLFRTAARLGDRAVGVILTGMGRDGAEGLLAMREARALTIAQDRASCVVHGMPKAAGDLGAVERVLPLSRIGAEILAHCGEPARMKSQ